MLYLSSRLSTVFKIFEMYDSGGAREYIIIQNLHAMWGESAVFVRASGL